MRTLLEKSYGPEDIVDIESDVWEAIEYANLPTDEYGFIKGKIKVLVIHEE